MLKRLKKIDNVQWYYEFDGVCYHLFYDDLKIVGGEEQDFTEFTGQICPPSQDDYRYSHGGAQYREAVQSLWELFPEYQTA